MAALLRQLTSHGEKHWSTPTPRFILPVLYWEDGLTHTHLAYKCLPRGSSQQRTAFFIKMLFSSTLCNHWLTHSQIYRTDSRCLSLTSSLEFLYAHVDHHGSLGVVGFDQRCEVAAVHLLDMTEVRLAVVRDDFGALLVDVQATVWHRKTDYTVSLIGLYLRLTKASLTERKNESKGTRWSSSEGWLKSVWSYFWTHPSTVSY